MPPKKDEKGKKGGKGAAGPLKEVDPANYIRKTIPLDPLGDDIPYPPRLSGTIRNVEAVFPEWTLDGEIWDEAHEDDVKILNQDRVSKHESLKTICGLQEQVGSPDKKAAPAKKDKKGGKAPIATELTELSVDEHGRALPRMFIGSILHTDSAEHSDDHEALHGFEFSSSFKTLDSTGQSIDPYLCAAYKLVKQYAPSILRATNDTDMSRNYLWRSIYPQSASGRPCYNPSGKYCVKLYLAGKWRKVTVSDVLPIREDGSIALASSSNPLELWPSILAKAIYTIYTSCGYHEILPSVDPSTDVHASETAQKVSHFVGFVLHVLTGWRPGSALSVRHILDADKTRLAGILQEILFGGTPLVPSTDIPGNEPKPIPADADTASAASSGGEGGIRGEDGVLMRTKKQFKEEFSRRLANRERVVAAIATREAKIERIDSAVNKPFSECFVICLPSEHGNIDVLPVLGLTYPAGKEDVQDAQFMVRWEKGSRAPDLSPEATGMLTAEAIAGEGFKLDKNTFALLNSPLPPNSPVEYTFVSLAELVQKGALIFGVDTTVRTLHTAPLGWHWAPLVAAAPAAATGKGAKDVKGGKDKGGAAAAEEIPVVCDPGSMPPVLLSIDTSQFFSEAAPAASLSEAEREEAAAIAEQCRELEGGGESSLRASEDGAEGGSPGKAPKFIPKSQYLSLSIVIHADISTPMRPGSPVAAAKPASVPPSRQGLPPPTATTAESVAGTSHQLPGVLPSNVVIVLQEIRFDAEDPLVMRVELSQNAHIPLTRTSFQIPAERLPAPGSGPFVFWVRLFTQASVYITFGCGEKVAVGPADEVWRSLSPLYHASVREGEAGPTRAHSEQLLFRVPMCLKEREDETPPNSSGIDEPAMWESSDTAMCFLHISDRELARTVSLLLLNPTSEEAAAVMPPLDSYSMPRLQGNFITLFTTAARANLLVARCFPSDKGEDVLPSFKWKLTVLCRQEIVEPPRLVNEKPIQSRFRGTYTPNNRLRIFQDVLKVDLGSFPLALRLSMLPIESTVPGHDPADGVDIREGVSFVLRMYRQSARTLVAEYRGRSVLQMYDISPENFIASQIEAAPADPKKGGASPSKDKSKGKGGLPAVEPLDLLLECCLDETSMVIPEKWRSRLPFYFDGGGSRRPGEAASAPAGGGGASSLEGGIVGTSMSSGSDQGEAKPSLEKFQWQLDVLAGTVIDMSHDIFDLQRLAAIKNGWEEAVPGRTERAIAALEYYKSSSTSSVETTNGTDAAAQLLEKLSVALGKAAGELQPRLDLLANYPKYKEHIAEASGEIICVDDAELASAREIRDAQEQESLANANAAVEKLTNFNANLKNSTKERISLLMDVAKANSEALVPFWLDRENYRLSVNQKNESIKYLLERSAEAIETCADEESGGGGGKKGKDKKKK